MRKFISLLIIGMIVGCCKKEEVAPQMVQPTIDQAIDAVLRGHPNSLRACYDAKLNAYFLDYGLPLKRGEVNDEFYHGWSLLQSVEYYQSANAQWFITDQPSKNYTQVYPVIDGLPCKEH